MNQVLHKIIAIFKSCDNILYWNDYTTFIPPGPPGILPNHIMAILASLPIGSIFIHLDYLIQTYNIRFTELVEVGFPQRFYKMPILNDEATRPHIAGFLYQIIGIAWDWAMFHRKVRVTKNKPPISF